MNRPVRVGIIGCGLIARRAHIPSFLKAPEAEIVALASGRIESANAAALECGNPRVYATWQELLKDPEVDAVDICTINSLHAPIAIAAARAGKHVLVEKPMAVTLAQADAMIAAARQAGVTLMVAHNLRFTPIFEELKRIVATGTIGRLLSARGVFMHAGPDETWGAESSWFWQEEAAGGGALLDLGIHMIDLLRWLIDRPAVEVTAMTARLLKPTFAEDNAMLLIRFEGDILASVQSSWTARPFPDREIVIHGELGHVAFGRSSAEPLVVYLQEGKGVKKVVPEVPATSAEVDPYVHFARSIQAGAPPLVSGEDARDSLALALAAYESARTGGLVRL